MKRRLKDIKHRITSQDEGDELDIFIFDEIFFFGVSAERIAELLTANPDVKLITVHINSPGGNALDGVAIYNSLVNHSATVDVIVEGMAYSAASLIAMAGDTIKMSAGSQMMVHEARGMTHGTAAQLVKFADLLKATSGQMAAIYAARSGRELAAVKTDMKNETFMTAEEAVEMGYAGEVLEAKALAAHFDLDTLGFDKIPDSARALCNGQPWGSLGEERERQIKSWGNVYPAKPSEGLVYTLKLDASDAIKEIERATLKHKTSPTSEAGDDNGAMVAPTPIAVMSGVRPASLVSDFGKGSNK